MSMSEDNLFPHQLFERRIILIIIIENSKLQFARDMFIDIYEQYKDKIEKAIKHRYEIHLKNGDKIKFISEQSNCIDGLRADVAIGPNAHCLTYASSQPKKIWSLADLENYLESN